VKVGQDQIFCGLISCLFSFLTSFPEEDIKLHWD
jgi:hypothetical protein